MLGEFAGVVAPHLHELPQPELHTQRSDKALPAVLHALKTADEVSLQLKFINHVSLDLESTHPQQRLIDYREVLAKGMATRDSGRALSMAGHVFASIR